MAKFNNTGKRTRRIYGRYIVETTAEVLYFSHGRDKRFMTKLFDKPTDTTVKTFIIEADGELLYADTVGTFELERVGNYEKFDAEQIA